MKQEQVREILKELLSINKNNEESFQKYTNDPQKLLALKKIVKKIQEYFCIDCFAVDLK